MLNLSWSFVAAKSALLLGDLSMGWLVCSWLLQLNCLMVELILDEPSTGWPDSIELPLTSAEPSTGWTNSIWTVYWVTWFWLNCLLGHLTDSTWTVYCWTSFWFNCWLVNLTLAELSSSWFELSWIVYWVTLNHLFVDFTLVELFAGWLDCGWTVYWLTWL